MSGQIYISVLRFLRQFVFIIVRKLLELGQAHEAYYRQKYLSAALANPVTSLAAYALSLPLSTSKSTSISSASPFFIKGNHYLHSSSHVAVAAAASAGVAILAKPKVAPSELSWD